MRPSSKKILGWVAGVFVVLVAVTMLVRSTMDDSRASARQALSEQLIRSMQQVLDRFYVEYGFYPQGGEKEVMATLRGDNPRKIVFIEFRDRDFNPSGELVDSWSTPFRMIQHSDGKAPEFISAGHDKVFGTADDIAPVHPPF